MIFFFLFYFSLIKKKNQSSYDYFQESYIIYVDPSKEWNQFKANLAVEMFNNYQCRRNISHFKEVIIFLIIPILAYKRRRLE